MSTRAICLFREDDETFATIYRHCDGYLSCMGYELASYLENAGKKRMSYPPIGLLAANFIASLNSGGQDTLELYPSINCGNADEMISYMSDTDWEYAYIVTLWRDGHINLSVNDRGRELFSGSPDLLLQELAAGRE